jgi:hypothetical protein
MDLLDAVYKGDVEGIKAATAEGANPNEPDKDGRTPLMRAAEWDMAESVAPLLAAGAKLEAKDGRGGTALFAAVGPGHVRVVEALIAAGADLTIKDKNGETPLTTALSCRMGFEQRSLQTARVLAAAMEEGAVKDNLRRRLERQQADLLKDRNETVESVDEVVAKMQKVGIDVLAPDERGELKKMLESAQVIGAEAAALQESGTQLLKEMEQDPRKTVDGVFEYGRKHKSLFFRAGFLRMSTVTFLHQL